jgi:hypothetical protein
VFILCHYHSWTLCRYESAHPKNSPMPTEIRHLIFSATEVVAATVAYNRARSVAMPSGTITEAGPVKTHPDQPISFRILVAPDATPGAGAQETDEVILGSTDLIATLIDQCKASSIPMPMPMPMKGSKGLQRFGSQVGLVVTIAGRNGIQVERAKA